MKEQFEISYSFAVSPEKVFKAWLDSKAHTDMTGGLAECSDKEGNSFTAWDGYINGRNITLISGQKIIQSWRTVEFSEDDEDSLLVLTFEEEAGGCKLILHHSNIPSGQTTYKQGWVDNYFLPMETYFSRSKI
ncbi:MAG: SRPBCC domain-containing protein [Bacteroidota bacterium]